MRKGAVVLVAVASLACEIVTAPPPSGTPAASPRASGAGPGASATGSPEPSPLPLSRPGVRATGVGSIPDTFRYVALDTPLADGAHTRLWLIDLSGKRAPALAAEWDAPAAPVGDRSVSADGKLVLISAAGARARVALYLVKAETGETRVLFEDPTTIGLAPRLSADGTRYAFTKYPAQGGSDLGIWAGRVAGGEARRITDPTSDTNVPQLPISWSPTADRLGFTRDLEHTDVYVVGADGGDEVLVGPGDKLSWRRATPEVLVAESVAPSSRIYAVDLVTRKATDLVKLDKLFVPLLAWHPDGDRFVYVASENAGREASGGIWLRGADGGVPTRVDVGRVVFAPEWSRDGGLLSALAGGDDTRIPIVDLLTGRQLSVLCRRGGTPPANCL